jgi:hypothetical protein
LAEIKDQAHRPEGAASGGRQIIRESAAPAEIDPNEVHRARLVVVIGMHRSGTSLCAHVLNALGIDMADEPGAAASNPKGHWERLEIVAMHDRLLTLFNRGYFDRLHDLPLPQGWWTDPRVAAVKRDLVAFLKPRLMPGIAVGFKDPRTARVLRLWQEISTELNLELKFVLCLRNPAEVARSLNYRDRLLPDTGQYRWFIYTTEIIDELRGAEICTIEYEQWFGEKADNVAKLIRFLGLDGEKSLPAIADTLAHIVDERLSHTGPERRQPDLPLVRRLYEAVCRFDADPAARAEAVRMVDQFKAFQQLSEPIMRELETLSQPLLQRLLRGQAGSGRLSRAILRFVRAWRT